jgi:hypothetical protein
LIFLNKKLASGFDAKWITFRKSAETVETAIAQIVEFYN